MPDERPVESHGHPQSGGRPESSEGSAHSGPKPEPVGGPSGGRDPAPVEFDLSITEEGIATLALHPRRGVSLPLRLDTLRALEEVLAEVERLAGEGSARILLVETAAPRPSLRGYDLEELRALRDDRIADWSREGQRVLRRLERLPLPSIAVVREEWLGGAAELALACSYRVATDTAEATMGFPQTRLGFLPAWGGTVRLPRLVGLRHAVHLILGGESLHADQALQIGLIDRLFAVDGFEAELERYALRRVERGRPKRRRRRPLPARFMDDTAPGRRLVASRAAHRYLAPSEPNLAARVALDLMLEAIDLPLDQAFAREAAAASELILGAEAQGRLHSERLTERAARRTPIGPTELQSIVLVGGGETGTDLAHLLLSEGMSVRIKDASRSRARESIDRIRARVAWEREQGRISEQQARRRSDRVEAVSGFGGFGTLDLLLVIPEGTGRSAVDLALEVESHVRPECLIGVHDWTGSVGQLQRSLQRPERVFGFQPALPVERYALLEIVPGSLTSPDTIAAARRLARRLGLTAVVIPDAGSTPGVRLLATYLGEAASMLDAGIGFAEIDQACTAFGFDIGPFQRIDAMGAHRVLELLGSFASARGRPPEPPAQLAAVADAEAPFYQYRSGRPAGANPDLPAAIASVAGEGGERSAHRLVLALINEAAKIVEGGAIDDPGDLDMISIHALGFPRERGGLLFHAQEVGIASAVRDLNELAERLGPRYAPVGLLRDLATSGGGFFGVGARGPSGHTPGPVLE